MKKISKGFWVFIGIVTFFFFVLILVDAVLDLGERIAGVHIYLSYAFYVIVGILFVVLIVRPLLQVMFSQTFSLDPLFSDEENAKKNHRMYKHVARNLTKKEFLSDEQKSNLSVAMGDPLRLKTVLTDVFDHSIKKEVNRLIVKNAETIFLSTAISQNGRLDSIAVFTFNLRMIRDLVLKCGFRPNYPSLGKLSHNVLGSAIIAENLEDINLSELMPSKSVNFLQKVPFLKTMTGSATEGLGNALLALRVGIICRHYLFMDLKGLNKKQIRKMAFAEAITLLPSVIATSVKRMPNRMKTIFEKIF